MLLIDRSYRIRCDHENCNRFVFAGINAADFLRSEYSLMSDWQMQGTKIFTHPSAQQPSDVVALCPKHRVSEAAFVDMVRSRETGALRWKVGD